MDNIFEKRTDYKNELLTQSLSHCLLVNDSLLITNYKATKTTTSNKKDSSDYKLPHK